MIQQLKAPFPYFGGKSKIAPIVWTYFGQVSNFVEPFAGSLAVLLACPHPGHTETVNDADALLVNFFRALQAAPDEVARYADYPVSELDLHARHRWLVNRRADVERLLADPDYYDAKAAGWWVWGISQWIGSGWCQKTGTASSQMPYLSRPGSGLQKSFGQLPAISAQDGGGERTQGVFRESNLAGYLQALAARLRRVRVTCGDFERVLGPSVTFRHGVSAIFLDPPYDLDKRAAVYAVETDAAHRAREWALQNGDNPLLRIALCGYDIEMPDDWTPYRWKANGGYGSQGNGRGRENAGREVVWFSPHCVGKTPLEMMIDTAPMEIVL